MRVNRRHRDWRRPQMMLLVNVFINSLVVHQSVRIIETEFLNQDANADLEQHPVEGGKLSNVRHAAPLHHVEREYCERNPDENLITDDANNDSDKFLCVDGFIGLRLDFVASQKLRTVGKIHDRVDRTESPVDEERVDRRPPYHQIKFVFACNATFKDGCTKHLTLINNYQQSQ